MKNNEKIKVIDKIYINGEFIKPNGTESMDIINPSTKEIIGRVILGNEVDTQKAIAAAKEAFKTFSKTTLEERSDMLKRLYDAVISRADELTQACVEEYGAAVKAAAGRTQLTANSFLWAKEVMEEFEFTKYIGKAKVVLEPVGVIALITPWNANNSQIAIKVATAISAGCAVVIKPSEFCAIQTQILAECFHEAGIPSGVINIVNGLGSSVGAELTRNPDVAMISFTGSTKTAKIIHHGAVDTMKRVILELGGKSPNIILDDADFTKAIPRAIMSCFGNNGQMCIAGSRLLVPEYRLSEVKELIEKAVENTKVGYPWEEDTFIGPMINENHYNNVQRYIKIGIEEGAELVVGGEGHPEGLENGNFVKPTVFANVTRDMTIAREEIFGPVLSILTYRTEEEAVEIANDTVYGLGAYISSSNIEKANQIASQIAAGTIYINDVMLEMKAPFGGFKQSGIGRECGIYGLQEHLEPKTIIVSKENIKE
ncbi:aldehyde dehydrogenase family protein [Clostridium sp. YIM B02569]|uniref:aldehyde dehydrogenase family protein n=1 Tax=Clostridium sp. YIM B02569 TaxID=2911967 RepID=UPI001EEC1CA4|nr:aldehyde dehydrogenase family protein [Clostridium sp. YIM B02569]